MAKPTTRVLGLLELLQTRGVTGGAELARALEVDRRTLRRYIAMLEELGIPIMTTQGRYGGEVWTREKLLRENDDDETATRH